MYQYFSVNIAWESICLASAAIFLYRERVFAWRVAVMYLFIVVLAEVLGKYFAFTNQPRKNLLVYVLLTFPELFFVSSMYYNVLKYYFKAAWLIVSGTLIVLAAFAVEEPPKLFGTRYPDTAITVMSLIFAIYGFTYIYMLIREPSYTDLSRHAPFWWVTGSVIYYFGGLACNLFFLKFDLKGVISGNLYHYIYMALNTFMYAFWSYSFKCRSLQKNSNSL